MVMYDHNARNDDRSVTSSSHNTFEGLVFPDVPTQVESAPLVPLAWQELQEEALHGKSAVIEPKSSSSDLGVTVWCRDLGYEVSGKTILSKITFTAQPGQLSVIMGPSGSGKSSLLSVLLDRVRAGKITGERGFNNQAVDGSIVRKYTHFVPASDIYHAYLTVRETLSLTCKLRCPRDSSRERAKKVDAVIKWMELQGCENTYVGGPSKRGISKGQMKRLSIACGLLDNPAVLVLDEPTSGLDSCLAMDIISLLSSLAMETNKTIIASIHQPSQRAYSLFHSLTLVSCGRVLFHGPSGGAVEYFAPVKKCGRHTSHPDYLLEIGTVDEQTFQHSKGKGEDSSSEGSPTYSTPSEIQFLADEFVKSQFHQETLAVVKAGSTLPLTAPSKDKRRSWTTEFQAIFQRSFLENSRNPLNFLVGVIVAILSSVMLGALFFQTATPSENPNSPHRPISKWPIWYSSATLFLAKGLDFHGFDPFMDLIDEGVGPNGRSVILELPMRQDIIDWLPKVTKCIRDRFGETVIADKNVGYPDYYWPAGSINRTEFTGMSPNYPFGTIAPEEVVNMIVQVLQVLDFVVTGKWDAPVFPDIYDAGAFFWLDAIAEVKPYVDPLVCCLGLQWEFSTTSASPCAATVAWPDPPQVGLGNYTTTVRRLLSDFSSPSSHNHDRQWWSRILQTQQQSKKALYRRSDGSLYTLEEKGNLDKEILESDKKNFDNEREILENDKQNFENHKKNLDNDKKNLARSKMVESAASWELREHLFSDKRVPRRRLRESGMGGIIFTIWKLMAANPDSVLYGLVRNLSEWAEKVNNCSTTYCKYLQSISRWIGDEAVNIGTSAMAAINVAGLVFIATGNFAFLTLTALLSFHTDKAIYNRDTANGLHRTSSYFFAKLCSDIPFHAIINLIWAVVFYFMVALPMDFDRMLTFWGISVLTGAGCVSFGYLCASLCSRVELAVIITPLLMLLQLTTSGVVLSEENMPKPVAWITYLSIFRYAQKAAFTALFPPNKFFGSLDNNLLLTMFAVTDNRCWLHCLCLFAHGAIARFFSFLAIKYLYRHHALNV